MHHLELLLLQANPVFLDKVTTWQRKLGTVDLVLGTWSDMQKKWQALVSIFLGSADIREQLPEDSKRFDSVNTEYQAYYQSYLLMQSNPWELPSDIILCLSSSRGMASLSLFAKIEQIEIADLT